MTKPKTLTLVKVEKSAMDWKADFELMVKALARGGPLIDLPMSDNQARAVTIIHWMRYGDLRPLAVEIAEGKTLDRGVGRALADLIAEGRLSVKQLRRGAGKKPSLPGRNFRMFRAFSEKRQSLGHEAALKAVAGDFGTTPDLIWSAVKEMKKIAGEQSRPELKHDLIP